MRLLDTSRGNDTSIGIFHAHQLGAGGTGAAIAGQGPLEVGVAVVGQHVGGGQREGAALAKGVHRGVIEVVRARERAQGWPRRSSHPSGWSGRRSPRGGCGGGGRLAGQRAAWLRMCADGPPGVELRRVRAPQVVPDRARRLDGRFGSSVCGPRPRYRAQRRWPKRRRRAWRRTKDGGCAASPAHRPFSHRKMKGTSPEWITAARRLLDAPAGCSRLNDASSHPPSSCAAFLHECHLFEPDGDAGACAGGRPARSRSAFRWSLAGHSRPPDGDVRGPGAGAAARYLGQPGHDVGGGRLRAPVQRSGARCRAGRSAARRGRAAGRSSGRARGCI